MRQIELHIFFNRGGGVTKWKPELYSEYFGYEAIGAEIHSVSDIFFSICDRSQAFPIFTKIRDLFYCNYAYAAYLTYVSHIYNLNSLFRQQLKFCCVITYLHLLVVALATCVLR